MKESLDFKEILVRKPIFKVLPSDSNIKFETYQGCDMSEPNDPLKLQVYTQSQMLREYYPSGHNINNPILYPDVYKKAPIPGKPGKVRYYKQPITRVSLAFQRIIKIKANTHICGNDAQFELASNETDEKKTLLDTLSLLQFKEGWLTMGMEERLYDATDSIHTVTDAAIVGYFDDDGNPQARVLSFLNGDKLYPHYDSITGKMKLFARKYRDIDEDGKNTTEWVEVWDDKYLYRYKRDISSHDIIEKFKGIFGLNGFKRVGEPMPHGFPFIPVAYHVNTEGPIWAFSQDTIEKYEEAMSYFFENNKAYAFPIFYAKGKGVKISGSMNGSVKAVAITDPKGEAGFLNQADVSTSYNTLLTKLYDLIYEQSFAVKPPELKSGDLPGVAVKLLFSPAIELAIGGCSHYQDFLEQCVRIVKYGWGFKINKAATLMSLPVKSWLEPYIHQNDSELMTNLATGVQQGFISAQTASERASKYTKNDEMDRILKEYKQKQEVDLLFEIKKKKAEVEAEIEKQKQINKITPKNGNVRTGNGRVRTTDENGNHEGENNWDQWDKTH